MAELQSTHNQDLAMSNLPGTVEGIIHSDRDLFFGDRLQSHDYETTRVFITNMLRELNGHLVQIDENVIHADISVTRKHDGHWRRMGIDFMVLGYDLVPLGTHVDRTAKSRVYTLDKSLGSVALTTPLDRYVVDRAPDEITLTRVLSDEEADKFVNRDTNLGSSHPVLWQDAIHTSLHNVTNEFKGSGQHSKVVGMIMEKCRLAQLIDDGTASVGTYAFGFKNRDPGSPFPFDAEVVFGQAAIPDLLEGYAEWSSREGVTYKDNPFS